MKIEREQVTLRLLPDVNKKLNRLADKQAAPRSLIVENLIKKVKEPNEEK